MISVTSVDLGGRFRCLTSQVGQLCCLTPLTNGFLWCPGWCTSEYGCFRDPAEGGTQTAVWTSFPMKRRRRQNFVKLETAWTPAVAAVYVCMYVCVYVCMYVCMYVCR